MKWAEISIHTSHEAIEAVANILHEAGAGGVIIEDVEDVYVKAYFAVNSYLLETIEQIKLEINNLHSYNINLGTGNILVSEVHEDDWASNWKQYYKPIKISEQFIISPAWEQVAANEKEKIIKLNPGMAFGTGTHPTTVMCINALENNVKGNELVIDVGCGTGVLSIAAAKLGVKHVLALDLEEVAVNSAKLNTQINEVDSIVEVRNNNLLDSINYQADIIVANILAEVILRFTSDVARILKPNGIFIASGIIERKLELVKAAVEKDGMMVMDILYNEDWVAIVAKKV